MSEAPARTEWIWIRHAPVQGQENRYYGQLDVAPEPVAPALAAAIARRLPAIADWAHPVEIVPPEGESFLDLATRVYAGIERLTDHYAGHTLISVAHANVVRSAIAHALGIDLATALRIEVAPLSITRLGCRIVDGAPQWSVGCINLEVAG